MDANNKPGYIFVNSWQKNIFAFSHLYIDAAKRYHVF